MIFVKFIPLPALLPFKGKLVYVLVRLFLRLGTPTVTVVSSGYIRTPIKCSVIMWWSQWVGGV